MSERLQVHTLCCSKLTNSHNNRTGRHHSDKVQSDGLRVTFSLAIITLIKFVYKNVILLMSLQKIKIYIIFVILL